MEYQDNTRRPDIAICSICVDKQRINVIGFLMGEIKADTRRKIFNW